LTPRRRFAVAGFLVFVLALLVRGLYLADGIALIYTTEQDGTRMARRYDDSALGILNGDGILFPRVWDKERTGLASRPPGYAMFLASIYATLGRSFPLVAATQDVLTSLAALLAMAFGWRLKGALAGVLSGVLVALSPHIAATSNLVLADAIASVPLLIGFFLVLPLVAGERPPEREVLLRALGLGVSIGVAIWLRPNVILLGPFAAVFLFGLMGFDRRAFRAAAMVVLVSLALVAPITLRNWLVLGEFVPVSINGGITLWQGVADAGGREYGARVWDKQVIAEEAERYGRPDYLKWWAEPEGVARDRDRYRRAMEVIRARPLWYARAMVRRMGMMLTFVDGPKPLRPMGAPAERNDERVVPLASVPGLDASIDEARFAERVDIGAFLRAPLRVLHGAWFVFPVLSWIGIALSLRHAPRATLLWLIVPLYYLVFESPFLYEWRVAVPMQYFLLPFAAIAMARAVSAVRDRA
jgi:hypothetical protein